MVVVDFFTPYIITSRSTLADWSAACCLIVAGCVWNSEFSFRTADNLSISSFWTVMICWSSITCSDNAEFSLVCLLRTYWKLSRSCEICHKDLANVPNSSQTRCNSSLASLCWHSSFDVSTAIRSPNSCFPLVNRSNGTCACSSSTVVSLY
jgi:hypothetical protein